MNCGRNFLPSPSMGRKFRKRKSPPAFADGLSSSRSNHDDIVPSNHSGFRLHMDVNPPFPMMKWSRTLICRIFPAAQRILVMARSSSLGSTEPDGWLCMNITEHAFFLTANRNDSRAWTWTLLTRPFVISAKSVMWFPLSSVTVRKYSWFSNL